MKQLVQSFKTGDIDLAEIPCPANVKGKLLISTRYSLISAGTERMLLSFGRGSLLEKARQQPEKVRQVLDKVRTDGLFTTLDAVRSKLEQPFSPGYCNVGVVIDKGNDISGFSIGDRVASNGQHAEVVLVPQNLCARIPDNVSDEAAAFTVIGAIALQGIRLAKPTLGECFVVTGLGLIGLMAVQLLRAQGCRVLGIDTDPDKVELARQFGAEIVSLDSGEDPVEVAMAFSRGRGVDGVLLTLSAKSNKPVSDAARMCRKRGRIVLVGITGLELNRSDFYDKELSFQVSCSYGPGRYDPEYEQKGQDYPLGFVRWTEQRNFEAVLDMMATGALDVNPLITHRFAFEDAPDAYNLLASNSEPYLGILLKYNAGPGVLNRSVSLSSVKPGVSSPASTCVAVIGAGNYAGRILIPAFHKTGAVLHTIANSGGVNATHYGRRYGFREITTDVDSLFLNPEINTVVVATRHDSHAHLVSSALEAGKHVFCEKPLALTLPELDSIYDAHKRAAEHDPRILMVGFNRRFAPQVTKMKTLLSGIREPKSFIVTVNAGAIPAEHWTQDMNLGGGRIIGEACHFVDLLRYLAGVSIINWNVQTIGRNNGIEICDDKVSITLVFEDGSFGTIHYLANGHKAFPKERVEVFSAGRVLQLDNFRVLRGYGWSGFRHQRMWRQDKGQLACATEFVDAVKQGGPAPISIDELIEVSRISIEIGEAART